MRLLAIFADRRQVSSVLGDAEGRIHDRRRAPAPADGDYLEALQACWLPCEAACLAVPLGDPSDRAVAEDLARALAPELPVWLASAREALLAAGLAFQPGLVLSEDLVMTRDSSARRQLWEHGASVEDLAAQASALAEVLPRVRRELPEGADELARARLLLELADFPGPEPGCKAAVAKLARTLCDSVRGALGRSGFTEPPRGCWFGPQFREPLVELFLTEARRYAPQVRWGAPRFPEEGGVLLMLASQLAHLRRQQPDVPLQLTPGQAWIGEDAWRQLSRNRRPLPLWR